MIGRVVPDEPRLIQKIRPTNNTTMDWIFEHIWVLVAIATVIARIVMKRKEGDASTNPPARPKAIESEDPQLAERTRKIREEIQRKIAERRGQHLQPPVPLSEPPRPAAIERSPEATMPPVTLPEILREVLQPKPVPQPARRMMTMNLAEETERQRALAEKLKEAELTKVTTQKRVVFETSIADKEPAALKQARAGLLDDMSSPQALRRAFVLREVLGPPVALR